MASMRRRGRRLLAGMAAAAAVAGCQAAHERPEGADSATLAGAVVERGVVRSRADGTVERPGRDWATIAARDTLVVAAPYNSTTYFIYRGLPLGY